MICGQLASKETNYMEDLKAVAARTSVVTDLIRAMLILPYTFYAAVLTQLS